MLAVARVVQKWEEDVGKAAGYWAKHIDDQVERSSANIARWEQMRTSLGDILERLGDIERKVQAQSSAARASEQRQLEAHSHTQSLVQGAALKSQEDSQRLADQLASGFAIAGRTISDSSSAIQAVQQAAAARLEEEVRSAAGGISAAVGQRAQALGELVAGRSEALQSCISGFLADDADVLAVASSRRIPSTLSAIEQRLHDLGEELRRESGECRADAERWRALREEAASAKEAAIAEAAEARQKAAGVEREMSQLARRLEETERKRGEPVGAPAAGIFGTIRGIERRGRVRMNRQSGELEVTRGVEFAVVKAGGPIAPEFRDGEVAAQVLEDIAEVWKMFEGIVDIQLLSKPGRGGKADFWERLAHEQACRLKSELTQRGIPDMMITFRGQTTPKGADPGLRIALKRDVFAEGGCVVERSPGKASKGRRSSPSPDSPRTGRR